MNNILKNNYKYIIIFIISGIIVSSFSAYAVSTINSKNVVYYNTTGMESTNVQDAIDEIYGKVNKENKKYDSSDISLTTTYNSSVHSLKDALDDLYSKMEE